MSINVFLASLGCAKNLVNSEQMLALLIKSGMNLVEEPELADVAIVNTCGFIEAAQQEAIETILTLAQLKKTAKLQALIVTGCLTERFQGEFLQELPEVDAALGTGSYTSIVEAVQAALEGKGGAWFSDSAQASLGGERKLLTPRYSAYLRIAEGCDNRCAYCIIPTLRGPYRSRPMEELVEEAKGLAAQGAKELLIIAQDITRYGADLYGARRLHELLDRLCQIEGLHWIRLHYLYPDEIDDVLLETIARQDKIVKYFDIPLQHSNDRVLRSMNRRGTGALIRERIDKIRRMMPEAVFRTSLIVGFPGETEEEFADLCAFLSDYRLERAGVFAYSREEGTSAYSMADQVPEEEKERRREIVFQLQDGIMDEFSSSLLGRELEVLCCGYDEQEGRLYGRTYMDSPDVDGLVWLEGREVPAGEFVRARIIDAQGCELTGLLEKEKEA